MKNKPEKIVKHGVEVWTNKETDELRKTECLCLNCEKLVTCKMAKKLYEICVNDDMAMMITRCPHWKLKQKTPREILYQAKLEEDNTWYEGHYYSRYASTPDGERIYHYIRKNEELTTKIIIPETLCEYSGKNDAKNNKIYENSIVTVKINMCASGRIDVIYTGIVNYDVFKMQWVINFKTIKHNNITEKYNETVPLSDMFDTNPPIVVGNAFDNADLLEVEGKQ